MTDGAPLGPELRQAHERLAEEVFAHIKSTGEPGELPDGPAFLSEAGVNPADHGPVTVTHTVQSADEGERVVEIECPGGGLGRVYPRCEMIDGKKHCVWVSTCP